ncbi:MAG: hypothetical protein WC389_20560 [Lutibacter sp.]|jgi:hypothetical protein
MKQGDRVVIIGNHPWKNNAGTFVGDEVIQINGQSKHKIRLDNGFSCFADDKNLEVIK